MCFFSRSSWALCARSAAVLLQGCSLFRGSVLVVTAERCRERLRGATSCVVQFVGAECWFLVPTWILVEGCCYPFKSAVALAQVRVSPTCNSGGVRWTWAISPSDLSRSESLSAVLGVLTWAGRVIGATHFGILLGKICLVSSMKASHGLFLGLEGSRLGLRVFGVGRWFFGSKSWES
ncbi:hypothetical protein VNO80_01588 [Phaseolus coccineus]|uniref:Uncharacterized protein n=1 Tax=Phaseolus coccineus TaxID=3886 RepID=A0AAN9WZC9_PHACN